MATAAPHRRTPALGGMAALYWLGNGIWLTFAAASTTTYPFASDNGCVTFWGVAQSLCFALAFFALAHLGKSRHFGRYTLIGVSTLALAVAAALVIPGLVAGVPALICAGSIVLACGKACGFCQWLRMLAPFGLHKAKWMLVLGSLVHIALTFCANVLSSERARVIFVFGACALVGTALLWLNVKAHDPQDEVPAKRTSTEERPPIIPRSMPLCIVCGVALTLITPIASSVYGGAGSSSLLNAIVVTLSHTCCLVILAIIWFILKRDVPLPRLYGIFLPLFATVVFVLPLLSERLGWVILFIGNGCYFFVSLLMVTTCLEFADRDHVPVLPLYSTFAGCMYLTDTARLAIERLSADGLLNIEPYVAALLLLYVLMIPTFLIVAPRVRKGAPGEAGAPTADAEPDGTYARIVVKYGLSRRQAEVMRHLARGRDVDHIADALGLSPNTVRSYRKSLYATLGVHGKQELLDLIEREGHAREK